MHKINLRWAVAVMVAMLCCAGYLALGPTGQTSAVVMARSEANTAAAEDPFDRAQSRSCSLGTLRGSYAFGFTGAIAGVGPISASGTSTFDGQGNWTISGFINTTTSAPVLQGTLSGTYTVNADCTGAASVNVPAPGLFGLSEITFRGAIVDQGREVRYLVTNPGVVLAGSTAKQ